MSFHAFLTLLGAVALICSQDVARYCWQIGSPIRPWVAVGRLDPCGGPLVAGRGRVDVPAMGVNDRSSEQGGKFGVAEYVGGVLPRVDCEFDLFEVLNAG